MTWSPQQKQAMNPIRQHIILHKESFQKNAYKSVILLVLAPLLEILFPASLGASLIFLKSESVTFFSYSFHFNPITILFIFLIIMFARTVLIQQLNKIKYNYCIEISHRLAANILEYSSGLSFKKLYQVDTKRLSTIATLETQQLTWRYFLPLLDLYIETGVLLILMIYFAHKEEYLVLALMIFALGYIFYNLTVSRPNTNTKLDKTFDPEDELRFQIEMYFSILRDGKFTLLKKAKRSWLINRVETKYLELKDIITSNIIRSANLKYSFEFLMFIILLGLLVLFKQERLESLIAVFILFLRAGYSLVKIRSVTINLELTKNLAQVFITNLSELKADGMHKTEDKHEHVDSVISKNSPSKILLELKDLQVGHDNHEFVNIPNGKFKAGDIVSLVGPSGSGKTTFVNTLIGALEPINGSVNISNVENKSRSFYVSPQNSILLPDTLINNLYLGAEVSEDYRPIFNELGFKSERLDQLLELANICDHVSGGEIKKIEAVRCLIHSRNSKIIIFDELDSALDSYSKSLLSSFIKKNFSDKLTIFITHDSSFRDSMSPDYTITLGTLGSKE